MHAASMKQYSALTDEQWFSTVLGSEDIERGRPLFPLPPRASNDIDARYEAEVALRDAFRFWQFCRQQLLTEGNGITRNTRILDFGVSYGSVIRFWTRDLPAGNLHGVDSRDFHLALAKSTVPGPHYANMVGSELPLDSASLDLVYSFSAIPTSEWMQAFARVLRPGGLACIAAPDGAVDQASGGLDEICRHAISIDDKMVPVVVLRKG